MAPRLAVLSFVVVVVALAPSRPARAAEAKAGATAAKLVSPAKAATAAAKAAPKPPRPRVGPLPAAEATMTHAPFEAGDCGTCHQREDPKSPGPVKSAGNELCFGCHDELQTAMSLPYKHAPTVDSCTNCHNPHNSKQRSLLVAQQQDLCFGCHQDIQAIATNAKVKHAALTTGAGCTNCHNPHGSAVEKLLVELPFDLCVKCHSKDGVPDGRGSTLTNFKSWLETNKVWHAPVKAKDCSACHRTHGSDEFRLLVARYPAKFYSEYNPQNYELCFTCHNTAAISTPQTTTLTGFRDGARNLHYLHVNQEHGRTCRACHEVHASKQDHHVRDGVPYGKTGWMLKLNFTKTATGGQCAKTCHGVKTYTNTLPTAQKR
ncbi:MAG TPA: cytochrome c3 family protein [Anaeromyxobacteraceae bacterium]